MNMSNLKVSGGIEPPSDTKTAPSWGDPLYVASMKRGESHPVPPHAEARTTSAHAFALAFVKLATNNISYIYIYTHILTCLECDSHMMEIHRTYLCTDKL